VLVLLWRGQRRGTRPLAVGAVVAVIWGWGVAQHPYLLPQSLTISGGAGNGTTLDAILIVFVAAVLIVIPALAFLYTLAQRSMLDGDAQAPGRSSEASNSRS
jgi:cytochrome bd ubiquinol oxidase subunit II